MEQHKSGPLAGTRVIELAGIGPGPFCGMMLGDMGAEVLRIDRPASDAEDRWQNILFRNRRSIAIDLKHPDGAAAVLKLCESADLLFEGYRPGVAERLGVGPQACLSRNPALVYGRMTGWGQDGPLAQAAGHDINYISLSGALHGIGRAGEKPVPPLNLIGDFGGGGMLLAFGLMCALLEARQSGQGQVVDASMVEGSAALMAMIYTMRQAGMYSATRGDNLIDGGAPYYDCYETRDGKYISIGAIEPQFFALLCEKLELPAGLFAEQNDRQRFAEQRAYLEQLFRQRTRDQWCALLEGTDACFAPVLECAEVSEHPHNRARSSYITVAGSEQQAPAPRFSRTPSAPPAPSAPPGSHTQDSLREWGFTGQEIQQLLQSGAAVQLPVRINDHSATGSQAS